MKRIVEIWARRIAYVCLIGLPILTEAETLKVGLYESPPLVFPEKSTLLGIYKNIFVEISKLTSDTFVFEYGNPQTVKKAFTEGKLDIEPGINPVYRKDEKTAGFYTIPFAKYDWVVLSQAPMTFTEEATQAWPSNKILKIGQVRDLFYPDFPKWLEGLPLNPVLFDTVPGMLKQFKQGKLDLVIVNQLIANYFIQTQTDKKQSYGKSDPFGGQDIMLRVRPDKATVIPRLNEAIKTLLQKAHIQHIYDHYSLQPEPGIVPGTVLP